MKHVGLGYKNTASLTPRQAQAIADGDVEWMSRSDDAVILGFYTRIRNEGLKAKVIVDYIREPFVFAPGNVRVALDYAIRTGMSCTDFLNPACVTVPIKDAPYILEVKWDSYLPDVIRDKEDDTDFINILSEMPGVNSAVIVSYNGDYMG